MAYQSVATLAPFLIADLGISKGSLGLLVSITQIGFISALFFSGVMADRYGERFILVSGALIAGLGALGVGISNWGWLIVALFFIGAGTAAIAPASGRAMFLWFPPENRGLAMGFSQVGQPVGGALAAAILPVIAIKYNWSIAVAASGILCILLGGIALAIYRNGPRQSITPQVSLVRTTLMLLRTSAIWLPSVWAIILSTAQFCLSTYLALFFHEEVGLSLTLSLQLLLVVQLVASVGRLVMGTISDRLFGGSRKSGLLVVSAIGVGVALAMATVPIRVLAFAAPLVAVLAGLGMVSWNSLLLALVAESVPQEQAATVIGLVLSVAQVGALVGPAVFGFLVDGQGSYRLAWLLLAGLMGVGIAVSAWIRPVRHG